jgi:hypothetical protein
MTPINCSGWRYRVAYRAWATAAIGTVMPARAFRCWPSRRPLS